MNVINMELVKNGIGIIIAFILLWLINRVLGEKIKSNNKNNKSDDKILNQEQDEGNDC